MFWLLRFKIQLGLWDLHLLGNLHLRSVEKLHIECKKSLCLDVATWWNSTYLMLEVVKKFEKVFVSLGKSEPRYMSYFF